MNDFRNGLKTHKIDPNPKAWEQMADMLDQEPKKKQRFAFWGRIWLTLSLLFIIVISSWYTIEKMQKSTSIEAINSLHKNDSLYKKTSNSVVVNGNEVLKSENILTSEESGSISVQKEAFHLKNYELSKESKGNKQDKTREKTIQNTKDDESQYNLSNEDFGVNEVNIKAQQTMDDLNIVSKERNDPTILLTDYRDLLNESNFIESEMGEKQDVRLILKSIDSIYSIVPKPIFQRILYDKIKHVSLPNYDIKPLFLTVGAGYSLFNGNPGYQLGIGVLKDQNRLIGFGAECQYSYGAERPRIRPYTFEQQFDINAFLQLNLLRTNQHKFYLDLSLGYTFYNGERVNKVDVTYIDVRSSKGINENFGLGYSYYLGKDHFIGFRASLVNYDDGITSFSLKYGRNLYSLSK